MSGIVGSRLNIRGSGLVGSLGTDGQVLSSAGAGQEIVFEDAAAGGDLSFGGDTFGADKTIGSNDTYALSFETDGNVAMKIDTAGIITKPLQPAFLAYQASSQTDLATDATTNLVIDTEVFDQNADFNTGTYTFTAPVTGRYSLNAALRLSDVDAVSANIVVYHSISTSNRGYTNYLRPYKVMNVDTDWAFQINCLTDMDAGDTALCKIYIWGGAAQSDTVVGTGGTYFSGHLAC